MPPVGAGSAVRAPPAKEAVANGQSKPPDGAGGDKGKDLWSLIADHNKTLAKTGGGDRPDSHVVFAGSQGGGKSTLLAGFLNPDKEEVPKPTQGLDYTFARRSASTNIEKKEVAHLWEVGGGPELWEGLMQGEHAWLPTASLPTTTVVIVVDLSKPSEVIDTLNFWLTKVQERVQATFARLTRRGSKLPEQLVARSKKQFGVSHEDAAAISHLGIPLIVVATKYDTFKNTDAELQRIMARTLRFVAHSNGAALVYTGGLRYAGAAETAGRGSDRAQGKGALQLFRAMVNHRAFYTPQPRNVEKDHSKMLVLPAGADSFREIGLPRGSTGDTSAGPEKGLAEWRALFTTAFPPQPKAAQTVWSMDFERFAEPLVDATRARKDADLESLRKAKENENKPLAGASGAGSGAASQQSGGLDSKQQVSRSQRSGGGADRATSRSTISQGGSVGPAQR